MQKNLNVLLLFDCPYAAARGYDFKEEFSTEDWATESQVHAVLKKLGHRVRLLGIHDDVRVLLEEIRIDRPDVVFNLAEVFNNKVNLDKNIVCLLEMLGVAYTGASPETMFICNDKALSKKILSFHRIKVPEFHTFYRGHKIWRPKKLKLPVIVKPLGEEASRGIAQASVADNDEALAERVRFIQENMKLDAIVEEYIDGREFYITVMGDTKIKVLAPREMKFGEFPQDEPRIATYKAKWDNHYRQKWGIKNVFAGRLPEGWEKRIADICKRAYRALNMKCYARFDIRVNDQGQVYIIEANANPNLQREDEVAQSAEKEGIAYEQLIRQILSFAFRQEE